MLGRHSSLPQKFEHVLPRLLCLSLERLWQSSFRGQSRRARDEEPSRVVRHFHGVAVLSNLFGNPNINNRAPGCTHGFSPSSALARGVLMLPFSHWTASAGNCSVGGGATVDDFGPAFADATKFARPSSEGYAKASLAYRRRRSGSSPGH